MKEDLWASFDLRRSLRMVWRRRWLWIPPVLLLPLFFLAAGFMAPRVFRLTAKVIVREGSQQVAADSNLPRQLSGLMLTVQGPRVMAQIASDLLQRWPTRESESEIVEDLQENLLIRQQGAEPILEVTYTGEPAQYVVEVVTAFAEALKNEGSDLIKEGLKKSLSHLEKQIQLYETQLRDLELQEEGLKKEIFAGLEESLRPVSLENLVQVVAEQLAAEQTALRQVQRDLEAAHVQQAQLEAQLKNIPSYLEVKEQAASANTDPLVASLSSSLAAAEAELNRLRVDYTEKHPQVEQKLAEVRELRIRLEEAKAAQPEENNSRVTANPVYAGAHEELVRVEGQIAYLLSQKAQLNKTVAKLSHLARKLPRVQQRLASLQSEKEAQRESLDRLLANRETVKQQLEYENSPDTGRFQIIPPSGPLRPINTSRRRLLLFGLVSGLGLGLALTLALEYFDRSIRSPEDLRRYVDAEVIAVLPPLRD